MSPGQSEIEFTTVVKGSLISPIDLDFAIFNDTNLTSARHKCYSYEKDNLPTISIVHTLLRK